MSWGSVGRMRFAHALHASQRQVLMALLELEPDHHSIRCHCQWIQLERLNDGITRGSVIAARLQDTRDFE